MRHVPILVVVLKEKTMPMSKEVFFKEVKKIAKKSSFRLTSGKIRDRWGREPVVAVAKAKDKSFDGDKEDTCTAAQTLGIRSDTAKKIGNATSAKCQKKNAALRETILEACGL